MNILSKSFQFQMFNAYVFGDYRNYYFDGISESIFNDLSLEEKRQAEDMLIDAMNKENPDERVIEAVGRFRIYSALPILHDFYAKSKSVSARLHAAWALFRMENDPQYIDLFVAFIRDTSDEKLRFTREDAIRRLPDFGKNPKSVELLLALRDVHGIYSVFKGNPAISNMIDIYDRKKAIRNWRRISKEVRIILESEK